MSGPYLYYAGVRYEFRIRSRNRAPPPMLEVIALRIRTHGGPKRFIVLALSMAQDSCKARRNHRGSWSRNRRGSVVGIQRRHKDVPNHVEDKNPNDLRGALDQVIVAIHLIQETTFAEPNNQNVVDVAEIVDSLHGRAAELKSPLLRGLVEVLDDWLIRSQ